MSSISTKVFYLRDLVNSINNQEAEETKDNIYINIKNAKKEWENAKNIFENATNPDLIDYAIYNIEATEKKYTYLLKQIKSGNVY